MRTIFFILIGLMAAQGAQAIDKVTCTQEIYLGGTDYQPQVSSNSIFEALPAKTFTLTKVGNIQGVDQYTLEDDVYGKRQVYYTLTSHSQVLKFSAPAYYDMDKERIIVLDQTPSTGKSYFKHSGIGGYEGPSYSYIENYEYQHCVVQ